MFRNGRTVDCIETFFLPMSSLGYDSSLWLFSAEAALLGIVVVVDAIPRYAIQALFFG